MYKIPRSVIKMKTIKNSFKYKNKTTLLGKLRKKFYEVTNWDFSEVVVVKIPVSLDGYKYLYRHLVKINRIFKGNLLLTLNQTETYGIKSFHAVISLKVIK